MSANEIAMAVGSIAGGCFIVAISKADPISVRIMVSAIVFWAGYYIGMRIFA